MTTLKYIGIHQPFGMVVDVEETDANRLLDSGEYELLEAKASIIIPKEEPNDDSKRFSTKV